MLVVAGNASVRSTAFARHDFTVAGSAFRDHIDRDDEAAAQETTQPVVVTALVTDSFDTKLNQRLKEQRDVLETDGDKAVLVSNSVAFEEKSEARSRATEAAARKENGGASWRRCTGPTEVQAWVRHSALLGYDVSQPVNG